MIIKICVESFSILKETLVFIKNKMQKNIKKIIISTGIISIMFAIPFSVFAITNVLTGTATNITDTQATLSGSANPSGVSTSGYFRYSAITPGKISPVFCNDIYGSDMKATNEVNLNSGYSSMVFKTNVTGLLPNTTYYFCAIASNKNEINYLTGGVNSFTTNNSDGTNNTNNSKTSITTKPALVVNQTSAYLNGFYNSISSSETWFEYKKKYEKETGGLATQYSGPTASMSGFGSPTPFSGIVGSLSTPTLLTPYSGMIASITDPSLITSYSGPAGILSTPTLLIPYSGPTASMSTTNNGWIKVDGKSRSGGSGTLSFLLTGLSPNTEYQYRAGLKTVSGGIIGPSIYGNILTFRTTSTSSVSPGSVSSGNGNGTNNNEPLTLGQTATPPFDALVHYKEGIETVFVRQIIANSDIAEKYGYVQGTDLNTFAWNLADLLARKFGYVNSSGKEIRVSPVDKAAYQLRMEDGNLTVYEYLNSKIIHIQKLSSTLRGKYNYEYYYNKR